MKLRPSCFHSDDFCSSQQNRNQRSLAFYTDYSDLGKLY